MAETEKSFLNKLQRSMVPLIKGNNTAKIFFLLLSVFLWFLINLSKEGYVARINYPVSYTDVPSGFRLINEPTKSLRVTLRGKGFAILRLKLRSLDPLQFGLENSEIENPSEFRWQTSDRKEMLEEELGENVQVIEIEPREVLMSFSPIEERKYKVHLRAKKDFSKFKTFYEPPRIEPDSISVWGTQAELDKVDSIFTEVGLLKAEEDSVTKRLRLDLPDQPGLEFSHDVVNVFLRYTSLTEGSFQIPLEARNVPASYSVSLIPKNVALTFRVPIEDFARVEKEDFEAFVDFRQVQNEEGEFLPVRMKYDAEFVRNVRVEPRKVEYILTQK